MCRVRVENLCIEVCTMACYLSKAVISTFFTIRSAIHPRAYSPALSLADESPFALRQSPRQDPEGHYSGPKRCMESL